MSTITHTQYTRLTDSLERNLVRDAIGRGEHVSTMSQGKHVLASVKKGFLSVTAYVTAVYEAMNEARAKSAHFTAAQW